MSSPRGRPDHAADEARFRALYAAAYDDLVRFAQRRTDRAHAEDVAAETMLVAWRRLDDLPTDTGDARAWLFGTARRLLLNARRGERRREALEVRIADAASTRASPDDADLVARRIDLARAWALLAPQHQEAIALAVWDDLTSAEAAAVLDISPVAYRLRLSRARRALRALADHLPDAPAGADALPGPRPRAVPHSHPDARPLTTERSTS